MLFDDPINHGKTQSRSLALFLGGKKRLKNVFLGFLVHAAAGVRKKDEHIVTRSGPGMVLDKGWVRSKVLGPDEYPPCPVAWHPGH